LFGAAIKAVFFAAVSVAFGQADDSFSARVDAVNRTIPHKACVASLIARSDIVAKTAISAFHTTIKHHANTQRIYFAVSSRELLTALIKTLFGIMALIEAA